MSAGRWTPTDATAARKDTMTRITIFFGIICFVVGIALGYLIAYATTPQTSEQQRAQAQLMLAQAKVEDAKAEGLRQELRIRETITTDLATMQKVSALANALLIPLACALIIAAIALWFWRGWKNDNAPAMKAATLGANLIGHWKTSFENEEPIAHKKVI